MAGPFGRIIAQAIVVLGSVAGRAFLQAYQQAAHQAKQGGQQAAKTTAKTFRKVMKEDEALKILNFSEKNRPKSIEEVIERYDRYFAANDPKKGGSFYLQSKIYRAKERLEQDFLEENSQTTEEKESEAKN